LLGLLAAFDLCRFTAKDLKGVRFALLIANPFLNLSPFGVAYGTNGFVIRPTLQAAWSST